MQAINPTYIFLSMLLALMSQLLPWSGFGLMIKPEFMLLVSIYWLLRAPNLFNIGLSWFAGLIVDLITGGIFGQNALAYAITAFFAVHYQRRLALFNIWQQAGYVFALLVLMQVILLVLKLFAGGESPGWAYFLPSVTGILLWQMLILSKIGIEPPPHKN